LATSCPSGRALHGALPILGRAYAYSTGGEIGLRPAGAGPWEDSWGLRDWDDHLVEYGDGTSGWKTFDLTLELPPAGADWRDTFGDRKSTRLNSSHVSISYA